MRKIMSLSRSFLSLLLALSFPLHSSASETSISQISKLEKMVVAICHTTPNLKHFKGTGFIVSSDGMIMTADHIITDKRGIVHDQLYCLRPNYPKYEKFKLILLKRFRHSHKGRDMALLRIDSQSPLNEFSFLSISEDVDFGDSVLTIGFPRVFGAVYLWPLFRKGSVSSIRYEYEQSPIIVLDMKTLKGFSGSPVISTKNLRVIGVMKGKSRKLPQSDFSVATPIFQSDLDFAD